MTVTEGLTRSWFAGTTVGVVSRPSFPTDFNPEADVVPHGKTPDHDWIIVVPGIPNDTMSRPVTDVSFPEGAEAFVPRTPLERRLLALRRHAIETGMKLLTEDEVLNEVRRRRGEIEGDEADLY